GQKSQVKSGEAPAGFAFCPLFSGLCPLSSALTGVGPWGIGRRLSLRAPAERVEFMGRSAWLLTVGACAGLLAGCVERRFVITSDPPGAVVLRDHQPIGATPADDHFVYYGKYHFTLIKEGFETLQVDQDVPTP